MPAAFEAPLSRGLATQTLLACQTPRPDRVWPNAHRPGAQEATAPVAQPPRPTDNFTTAAELRGEDTLIEKMVLRIANKVAAHFHALQTKQRALDFIPPPHPATSFNAIPRGASLEKNGSLLLGPPAARGDVVPGWCCPWGASGTATWHCHRDTQSKFAAVHAHRPRPHQPWAH
jgi:hypothetical protein